MDAIRRQVNLKDLSDAEKGKATYLLACVTVIIFASVNLLSIPASATGCSESWSYVLTHPWNLLTYMFVHYDVWHLISNLAGLLLFGNLLERLTTGLTMVCVYICGGMAGAVCYQCGGLIDATTGILCGASASVAALMSATVVYAPGLRINYKHLHIMLTWIIAITLPLLFVSTGKGTMLAHSGGLAAGILYAFALSYRQRKTSEHRTKMNSPRDADSQRLSLLVNKVRLSGFDSLPDSEKIELQHLSQYISATKSKEINS